MLPLGSDRRRLAVTLAGAAAFVNLYAPQSLMPLLQAWLGSSAALAGAIVSAGTLGVALAAPFAGLLADRIGRRRVILLSAFGVVPPALMVALAQSATQLIAARFVQGLFLPGIFGVTVAYIGASWPPQEARVVTASYVAGTIFGGFCGRLTSGVVAQLAGWRWGFAAITILQLLLALLILAWLPPERHPPAPSRAPAWSVVRALLRRPELRGAYALGFSLLFSLVAGFTYVTLRLAAPPFSLGPAALSALFVVYLVGVVITPVTGQLLNRAGHRRVLTVAWGVAVTGLLVSLSPVLPVVVLGLALFSAGLFVVQATATSFVSEVSGAARATSVGLYVTCYYVGGSVGGVLPAPLWSRGGWPAVVLLIAAAGAASVLIGRRTFARAAASYASTGESV